MEIDLKVSGLQDLLGSKPVKKPAPEEGGSLKRMNVSEEGQGNGEAVVIGGSQAASSAYSYAESITKTLTEAAQSITEIREKQQSYTKQAANSADSDRQAKLNTEIAALENEIGRVADSATVNGRNVLKEGGSVSLPGHNFTVSVAANSGIADAISLDTRTQEKAQAALDTIEPAVSAARITRTGAESAQSKVQDGPASKPQVELEGRSKAEEDIDESQALAAKVAEQVGAQNPEAAPVQDIISAGLAADDAKEPKKKKAEDEEEQQAKIAG